ncbi:MAG TPA: SAM-dependent methyltransferase [Trebonia sp.]|nr:SAM-dependent methyltransferase [Trebonia sp.]
MTSQAQDQDPSALGRVDMSKPSPARIWNYFLGGKDNFAVDREAAASAAEAMPFLPEVARQVRSFQGDVVRRLVARGVRQFLDIGTGLPVAGSVHEVAQQEAPESRVVYVDNDPMVLAHARALLTSSPEGACAYIDSDLRDPAEILSRAAETLDLGQPVAVLLIAVLHFIPDSDDPWGIAGRLLDGVTGDAYLAISHGASDLETSALDMASQYNDRSPVSIWMRPRDQVARFYDGLDMLPPGLVTLGQWVSGGPASGGVADLVGHVGIGWRPAPGQGAQGQG